MGDSPGWMTVRMNSVSDVTTPFALDYIAGHSNTGYVFNRTVYEIIAAHRNYVMSYPDGWYAALRFSPRGLTFLVCVHARERT